MGRPDTSGFPGSQSSILRNDSITTDYTSEGRTEAHTDDRLDLSNFLHPGIRDSQFPDLHGSASTSMPSLTTPMVSEVDGDYGPTLADAIDELTLSGQGHLTAPVTQAWTAAPDDSLSSFAPSLAATHRSGITTPLSTRKITRAPLHSSDQGLFTRHFFPTPIPIRVYFLSRQFRRRKGIVGAILRWRIRIEESYHGAFAEFGITLGPGHYVFEDMGNPLCFVGQQGSGEGVFFTFPLRHSPAWISQNVADGGDATQSLLPCYLPLTISRPPRIGGFLHPHCYGVPGHLDTCKRSQKAYYLVLHTFEGDSTIVCQSYAAALYRGRAASHFSRGGQITMRGFPTEEAALDSARLHTPSVVKYPALVPYIKEQLEHLEMVDDADINETIHDPATIKGQRVGRHTPRLFAYNVEPHAETLWKAPSNMPISADHIIQVELRPPKYSPPAVPREIQEQSLGIPRLTTARPSSTADSISSSSHSNYPTSEERERSKDRLKSIDLPPMPLATKDLHQWVQNLPWQLYGQHWCHEDVHACDLLATTADTISLSRDLLTVIMRSATAHKVGTVQRAAQSMLQDEVQGVNGLDLIKSGKGFELFQSRVRTGFSRGPVTETYEALWEYVHAVQQNVETVGAFFERLKQLYAQVQLTKGCKFGEISRKTLALKGMENGAYHDVLAPWVQKILAGQNKIKVDTSTMDAIQGAATNILVASRYYSDHTIQSGRLPACARAANTTPPTDSPPSTGDAMKEGVIDRIRAGEFLSGSQARWIRDTYSCIHCFSKTHGTESCHKLTGH
jgi:hypothetical protein